MKSPTSGQVPCLMTLDVEGWEHANYRALSSRQCDIFRSARESNYSYRQSIETWCAALARHDAKSTCFVLGEFAVKHPEIVRRLHAEGHEIGYHGFHHVPVDAMTAIEFRENLKRGVGVLGELTGEAPVGFRAPCWSLNEKTPWAGDELKGQGFRYDSSLLPISSKKAADYGLPRIAVSVLPFFKMGFPFGNGTFFRLAPRFWIAGGIKHLLSKSAPLVIALHPRELDPHHPRLPLTGMTKWFHYGGLQSTVPKLEMALSLARWQSIKGSPVLA